MGILVKAAACFSYSGRFLKLSSKCMEEGIAENYFLIFVSFRCLRDVQGKSPREFSKPPTQQKVETEVPTR